MALITKSLRQRAMDLLALREHSRQELFRKLQIRAFDEININSTLDQLEQDNLLSDERFAHAYVNMRSQRGYGPQRIKQELRERGVSANLINQSVNHLTFDWPHLAARVRQKKFGNASPTDFPSRAKQMQFLQYRGFTMEQIDRALLETPKDLPEIL